MNLLEATVATAIVATVAGATLAAAANAAHAAGGDPVRDALQNAATREARLALDVLKYQDAALSPHAIATSVPTVTGTPMPVSLSLAVALQPGGATTVTVTAIALDGSGKEAGVTQTLDERAPLPGAQTRAPGLVPAPTGAP